MTVESHLRWSWLPTMEERKVYLPAIWYMAQATYGAISGGLSFTNPEALIQEYNMWWLVFESDGSPIAARAGKTTDYGLKLTFSASNGSKEAKRALKSAFQTWFHEDGYYGEVSHKVEQIALASSPPVVCASRVPNVLSKVVNPMPDGMHYERVLTGIGPAVKIMVGRPKRVSTVQYGTGKCLAGLARADVLDDWLGELDSYALWDV